MFEPTRISNLQDLIEYGKNLNISHGKLHYQSTFDTSDSTIILNHISILDKYNDYLKKIIVNVTLTDDEYFKYRFQPKRLSYDIYGTTELWSLILKINNMVSAIQFTELKIKLFTQDIFDVINEILILEDSEIKANRQFVHQKIKK